MRVAADRGLEAVSLRHVAAEAGVSAGMVQHYFRTKDEMMTFAMAVVREHHRVRATAAVAALGGTPSPRSLVRTVLAEILPLDEARRADGRVALAFLAYTAVRPAAGTLREDTATMLGFVADEIRAAQSAGDAHAHIDPDAAAAGLLAAVEGLGVHLLGGHFTTRVALEALDTHLDLIFVPRGEPR